MTQKRANPADESGALDCLAGRLDASEYTQNRRALQDSAAIGSARWERHIEHLHHLGPRVFGELLAEIAHHTGESGFIADRLQAYAGLDRAVLRAVGDDSFPPNVSGVSR